MFDHLRQPPAVARAATKGDNAQKPCTSVAASEQQHVPKFSTTKHNHSQPIGASVLRHNSTMDNQPHQRVIDCPQRVEASHRQLHRRPLKALEPGEGLAANEYVSRHGSSQRWHQAHDPLTTAHGITLQPGRRRPSGADLPLHASWQVV